MRKKNMCLKMTVVSMYDYYWSDLGVYNGKCQKMLNLKFIQLLCDKTCLLSRISLFAVDVDSTCGHFVVLSGAASAGGGGAGR
jgi:hypothetical protein